MRKKIAIAAAAGALTLTGLAVAAPALAGSDGTGGTATSAVDRIKDALSGLVDDGSITQEQADEVATTLSDSDVWRGGHPGWGGGLDAAAEALGMTEDELHSALEADGATLATVAEDRGVAVQTLIDALVTATRERAAQAVTDGKITQEQADEWLADVQERVTERVNGTFEWHGPRGPWHGDDD
jgi:polyhydroxyalkanoate synthesis regulator phasin